MTLEGKERGEKKSALKVPTGRKCGGGRASLATVVPANDDVIAVQGGKSLSLFTCLFLRPPVYVLRVFAFFFFLRSIAADLQLMEFCAAAESGCSLAAGERPLWGTILPVLNCAAELFPTRPSPPFETGDALVITVLFSALLKATASQWKRDETYGAACSRVF